mgnify:CR=1 FL=1
MNPNDKYGKLVLGVLGAVQASSSNQLEKDLLGAVISIEVHAGQAMQAGERAIDSAPAPQIAAPATPQPSAEPSPQPAPVTAEAPPATADTASKPDAKPAPEFPPNPKASETAPVGGPFKA